ncbi:MAG: hypothetical protein ACRBCI_01605 [Cellvibrionaceae bacterium]
MRTQIFKCIQGLFESACLELFDSFNCHIKREYGLKPDLSHCPIGVIQASSHDIEICVFIQIPNTALALSYPLADDSYDVDDDQLEDWLLEIANQLIGRFKNKLDKHSCHAQMGLPDCKFDTPLKDLMPESASCFSEYFNVDGEIFGSFICVTLLNDKPSFSLEEIKDADVMEEGDIELF